MRRTLFVTALALVAVALVAAPAMGQARDPFQPLIDPNAVVPGTSDPGTVTDPGTAPPVQPSEPMPNTGANTTDWTAGAYILMVFGGALLVLGRLNRSPVAPAAKRRR